MLSGNRFRNENEFADLAGYGCAKLGGFGRILPDVKTRLWRRGFDELTGPMQIDKKAATGCVVGRMGRSGIPLDIEGQDASTIIGAKEKRPAESFAIRASA